VDTAIYGTADGQYQVGLNSYYGTVFNWVKEAVDTAIHGNAVDQYQVGLKSYYSVKLG
jgi:hypothetical protein